MVNLWFFSMALVPVALLALLGWLGLRHYPKALALAAVAALIFTGWAAREVHRRLERWVNRAH